MISVNKDVKVSVGALGALLFRKGFYAYVGSAQNCLEKRLRRYFQGGKRKFWHIDYLLAENSIQIMGAFFKEAVRAEECRVAQKFAMKGLMVEGFGCSDCRCQSHLFCFEGIRLIENLCLELGFKPFSLSCQRVAALGNI